MRTGQIRQGDVLLVPVDVAAPTRVAASTEVVLAEGEVTGHAHRLRASTVLEWSVGAQRYVRVEGSEPGTISHEEHDPTPAAVIVPGVTYQVIPQQEWSLESQWRRVVD